MARMKKVDSEAEAAIPAEERIVVSLVRIATALERIAAGSPAVLNTPTGAIPATGTLREEQGKLAEVLKATGQPYEKLAAEAAKPEPKPDPVDSLLGDSEPEKPKAPPARTATFEEARTALVKAAEDKPKGIGTEKVLAILKSTLSVERLSAAPKDEEAFGRFVTALEAAVGHPLVR